MIVTLGLRKDREGTFVAPAKYGARPEGALIYYVKASVMLW